MRKLALLIPLALLLGACDPAHLRGVFGPPAATAAAPGAEKPAVRRRAHRSLHTHPRSAQRATPAVVSLPEIAAATVVREPDPAAVPEVTHTVPPVVVLASPPPKRGAARRAWDWFLRH